MGHLLRLGLKDHEIIQVYSMEEAVRLPELSQFDLFLVDVCLPEGGDGFALCEHLSKNSELNHIPKIILTTLSSTSDVVHAFNCGADDFITKPFEMPELRARVDSKIKTALKKKTLLVHLCFEFDLDRQQCHIYSGKTKSNLELTGTEFNIFLALVKNEGVPLSRQQLVAQVWKGVAIENRGVDVHISNLRRKLGPAGASILSIYNEGYAFSSKAA